eukprot:scaffold1.g5280.t1
MVEVPLASGEGVLVLRDDEVECDACRRILKAERAPLRAWLAAARALLDARGDGAGFAALLEDARRQPGGTFERVQVLCCLAAYYAHQAAGERDRKLQSDLNTRASELVYDARNLDLADQLPHLVLGQMNLAKASDEGGGRVGGGGGGDTAPAPGGGDLKAARAEFARASERTCNGRRSIAGTLALAGLAYRQGSYIEAAQLYKQAIRACPAAPAEARLGLAVCFFKLGHLAKATAAYERVLDLQPACTSALLGLAVLKMHWGASEQDRREGSQLLVQAFSQDPRNPSLLALLAHFCLQQSFPDKALRLAQARARGRAGRRAALELAPNDAARAEATSLLARAHHAAGQLQEAYKMYQQACFCSIRSHSTATDLASQLSGSLALPKFGLAQISILQVLGVLYPKLGGAKPGRAVAALKAAADRAGTDAELWELLGDVLASVEPAGALQAFTKAIELRQAENGRGGAHLPTRLANNAAVLYLRAGDAARAVTLGYNMARCREAAGEVAAAEAEYRALLQQFPQYGDCLLRLASIARRRGDFERAAELARQAAESGPSSHDGMAFLAALHLEHSDAKEKELAKQVALGNIYLYSAPTDRRKEEAAQKAERQLTSAMGCFRRALERDEGNIYAANGVGCVLAELGDLDGAKDVQEAAAAMAGFWRMPDVGEQYTSAVKMYSSTLKRFFDNRSAQLSLYLARALYDADRLPEAKRVLARALHAAPADRRLLFNVGFCMQEWAQRTLRKERPPGDPTKLSDFRRAAEELVKAHRVFLQLRALGPALTGLETKKIDTHVNFVSDTHNRALMKREFEEAQAAALREAAARRAQAKAAEAAARLERMRAGWQEAEAKRKVRVCGWREFAHAGGGGGGAPEDDHELDAEAEGEEFEEEEEEEEDEEELERQLRQADGGGGGGGDPGAKKRKRKKKRKQREGGGGGGAGEAKERRREGKEGGQGKPRHRLKKQGAAAPAPAAEQLAAPPPPADLNLPGLEDALGDESAGEGSGGGAAEAAAARKRARLVVASDSEDDDRLQHLHSDAHGRHSAQLRSNRRRQHAPRWLAGPRPPAAAQAETPLLGLAELLGYTGEDPGHWNYSPEWHGTQGGSWGRDEGATVFAAQSAAGNGRVTVTAHPASRAGADTRRPGEPARADGTHGGRTWEEWRVLRFNDVTRQTVARVTVTARPAADASGAGASSPGGGSPGGGGSAGGGPGSAGASGRQQALQLEAQPDCLAQEYLKTMASVAAALIGLQGLLPPQSGGAGGSRGGGGGGGGSGGAARPAPQRALRTLCIGVGGGSLPLFLAHHFPFMEVDAVEIDPVVVEAALEAMGFPPPGSHPRLRLHTADAAAFLLRRRGEEGGEQARRGGAEERGQQVQRQRAPLFDLCFMDAFDGKDAVPAALCTPEFASLVAGVLHPAHGVFLANLHSADHRGTIAAFKAALFGGSGSGGGGSSGGGGADGAGAAPAAAAGARAPAASPATATGAASGSCFTVSTRRQGNCCAALARGLALPADGGAARQRLKEVAAYVAADAGYLFPAGSRACHGYRPA